MKQHITEKQLKTLTKQGAENLRAWWGKTPSKLGSIELARMYNITTKETTEFRSVTTNEYEDLPVYAKKGLPLLSIGQMIEFLDEHTDLMQWENFVETGYKEIVWDEQLCDELWERVKQVLKEKA